MGNSEIKVINIFDESYTPIEGEVVRHEDGTTYIYMNGEYNAINTEDAGLSLTVYEMNKQIITQLPELDKNDIEKAKETIMSLHEDYNNEYYMLYGKEISYFTLFKVNDDKNLGDIVIECLHNVGVIKAIDKVEANDAIEMWVTDNSNEDSTCLYFFPYDMGLVIVGE